MADKSWHISRRTLLQGMGASVALPWLEAMAPAFAKTNKPPLRMAWIYHPIGVEGGGWKAVKSEGKDLELPPTLKALEPVKDSVLIVDGLDRPSVPNDHLRAVSYWLSSATPGRKDKFGFGTDTSLDQVFASKLSQGTPLRSLELSCDSRGRGDGGMHASFVSWQGPGLPSGVETNPRQVWGRMFGDAKRDQWRRSVLDLVAEDARQLKTNLGSADQRRLDEYLESVQSVEKRIAAFERDAGTRKTPALEVPKDVPSNLTEYVRIMADLFVLALETDLTRVVTFMLGAEGDHTYGRRLVDFGIDPKQFGDKVDAKHLNNNHHGLTHSQPAAATVLQAVDRWHVSHLAYIVEKLQAIREGDGTLLDNSIIAYGSHNGSTGAPGHSLINVPCLMVGKGGGALPKTGRRVECAKGTPLSNLWLTLTQLTGIERKQFGLSTGTVSDIG